MDLPDVEPWLRLGDEPRDAFHAFQHYLGLVPFERSCQAAYADHLVHCRDEPSDVDRAPPEWESWAIRWDWLQRSDLWDAEAARRRLKRIEVERQEADDNHRNLAAAMLAKVGQRMQGLKFDELNVQNMPPWIKTGVEIQRAPAPKPGSAPVPTVEEPRNPGLSPEDMQELFGDGAAVLD